MALKLDFSLFNNAYKLRAVTNPNPLKSGKYKFSEDGLYSEQIFGPLKTFKCICGNLFSRSNAGKRCEKCGVLCDTRELRSTTFARIDLPKGVYVMLPIMKNLVQSIFGSVPIKNLLNPKQYEKNKKFPYFYSLSQKKLIKLRKAPKKDNIIYLPVYDITTLHRLYRSMLNNDEYKHLILSQMNDEEISKYIFINFILVTPPDSRPLAKLNDQYQAHPMTAAYIEILKNIKNSFLDRAFVSNSEGFGQTIYKYQNSINKLYFEVTDKPFQRKESIVRESLSGKTVETSQRSTIIPEPILSPGSIAISEESVKKLFMLELLHFVDEEYNIAEAADDSNMMSYCTNLHNQIGEDGNIEIDDEFFEKFITKVGPDLRMLFERPPVLWRYNISGVLIQWVYKGDEFKVVGTNTMVAPMFNMDFDGDTMSVYALTSKQAKEDFKYSYVENSIEFEHHRGLILSLEHESTYASYMLSLMGNDYDDNQEIDYLENINDLPTDMNILINNPKKPYHYKDTIYSYNILFINKALNTGLIIYTGEYLLDKKHLQKLLKSLRAVVGDEDFYSYAHNFNKVLLECSTTVQYCNPTFDLDDFAIGSEDIINYKKTLVNEPFIGFHQNDILFKEHVGREVHKNKDNILSRVFNSGARIKSVQLLKAVGNNGIPTNIYGKAFNENIKNSLLDGLTEEEFFMGGDSARLALAQRQEAIPKGGELQRKFYYSTGFLKLSDNDDCGDTRGFEIKIKNKKHLETLYGRYLAETGEEINTEDLSLIGKIVKVRAPIMCKESDFKICKKCFGKKQPQSESLGASIGSYLSESIIQSVLRTHHFSGAFITNINDKMISLIHKLRFESPNLVYYKDMEDIEKLQEILNSKECYGEPGLVKLIEKEDIENCYEINVIESPFNDDSVKQLNNIISIIDKNRDMENLITPSEMYESLLDSIILPNGILSIYIELVIGILFFDEEDKMIRYSDMPPVKQVALKNIIDHLSPNLAIFHNFSNKAINRIYTNKNNTDLNHMFFDLINCYQ